MIYIFDLDGTLADCSHRLHFIQQEPKDWGSFYAECTQDEPINEVLQVARALSAAHDLVIITGRNESIRDATLDWLTEERILVQELYMRPEDDHREDYIVKAEHLDHLLKTYRKELIGGVFEDRKQCVDMYRARGLRVFQVAEGNF